MERLKAKRTRNAQVALTLALTLTTLTLMTQAQGNAQVDNVRGLNSQLLQVYEQLLRAQTNQTAALRSQAQNVIQRRAAALKDLIAQNPKEALRVALSEETLIQLRNAFPAAAANLEETGEWTGELEYLVQTDHTMTRSHSIRLLKTGTELLEAYFADAEPGDLKSGDRLTIRGVRLSERVAAADGSTSGSVAAGSMCTPIGPQKSAVLLVTFPGVTAPNISPASVSNIFFGASGRTVSEYWRENSYGQATATGDVFGWYTLDAVYTCDQYSAMRTAAIKAADADVDFTQYSRIFIIFPNSGSCSWAGLGTIGCGSLSSLDGSFVASTSWMLSGYFANQDQGVKLSIHEGGHNLGLHHASSRDFGTEALAIMGTTGTLGEYGDVFSSMGSWNFGHYAAPHKSKLNWLNSTTNIRTVQSNGSFSVQPMAQPGSVQALKIQRSTSDWLWLEYRQPMGLFDSTLSSQIFSGATLHYQDSTTGTRTHLLDFTPATTAWNDPALAKGLTWVDPYTNLSISVSNTSSASALNVDVAYGPLPCIAANPTVTISPSNPSVYAGKAANYTVSVRNNDTAGCAARPFDVSSLLPSTWPTAFSNSILSIAPAATMDTTMSKSVPATAPLGTYSVDARAAAGTNSATGAASLTVVPEPPPLTITVATSASTYAPGSTVAMTATVLTGTAPAAGAAVTFTLTRPDGSVSTKNVSSGSGGVATWNLKLNPKAAKGTYRVSARATWSTQSATTATPASFTVQ